MGVPPVVNPLGRRQFTAANWAYLADLYEQYLSDPVSVPEDVRQFFDAEPQPFSLSQTAHPSTAVEQGMPESFIQHVLAAKELVRNIREYGHLNAHFRPTDELLSASDKGAKSRTQDVPELSESHYGLNDQILAQIPAHFVWPEAPNHIKTAEAAVRTLRQVYSGVIAYEFAHVWDPEERAWLENMVESGRLKRELSPDQKKAVLRRLCEVEGFEKFLHRTYAGQKRFSIEGLDALVPMLGMLVHLAVVGGAKDILIGMAHRGRLNVLAHVLGKPYEAIFAEFQSSPNKELVPSEGSEGINRGWTGDVKYHLGYYRTVREEGPVNAHIRLANNPSHLEFVNPVVLGSTRAAQDDRTAPGAPVFSPRAALGVLVHGDAAFPGEGVVAETFNFSRVLGYKTGGTIHIIANNRLGFTAEEHEGRSTLYASDLAKGFEVPIVHVSADEPEACLMAIRFAHEYRVKFGKDFLIDLVGYRRFGHNEMDDPAVTQPMLYKRLADHKTVKSLYADKLQTEGILSKEELESLDKEVLDGLKAAQQKVDEVTEDANPESFALPTAQPNPMSLDALKRFNDSLLHYPSGFHVYPKLAKVLERRRSALTEGGQIDWALAEALALASILSEGTPIRFTGQDTERGTFAHRHLVLHDAETGEEFIPLQSLPEAKASFAVHNSPLTETGVLGFEYGYNVQAPGTLTMWEAQFGDFANVAQVIIDQFIAAGHAKWGQSSGLVMLLPHGYEGQGPEHSSGRVERFLQLAANHNLVVANVTKAGQYFHLLRRHAARLGNNARPLIVMTPKSLLRNPRASSSAADLVEKPFQPVLSVTGHEHTKTVTRLVLSSGKVGVDLVTAMEPSGGGGDAPPSDAYRWLAHARIEELYPFPREELLSLVAMYPSLHELVWLQEEPQNMGAWNYIRPHLESILPASVQLRYIGRTEHASPAEGHAPEHNQEQTRIIQEALTERSDG